MKTTISSQMCKSCAECCKHFAFVELSHDEINALEEFTGLTLDAFTNPKGKDSEEHFLAFKENGDCFFLKPNNDNYACSVYETRPAICKNYPSSPIQNKTCHANRTMCTSNCNASNQQLNSTD